MRQRLAEQLGTAPKTVDFELQRRIAKIKEDFNDCRALIVAAKQLAHHATVFSQAHSSLAACLDKMAVQVAPLKAEFSHENKLFDAVGSNTLLVISSLTTFSDELSQLLAREFSPLWPLLRNYEVARVDFDVCRLDADHAKNQAGPKTAAIEARLTEARERFESIGREIEERLNLLEQVQVRVSATALNPASHLTLRFRSLPLEASWSTCTMPWVFVSHATTPPSRPAQALFTGLRTLISKHSKAELKLEFGCSGVLLNRAYVKKTFHSFSYTNQTKYKHGILTSAPGRGHCGNEPGAHC
jgi:hypothetical protein